MSPSFAVIFDMDGTLVDNSPYHALAWQEFCRKRGMRLNMDEYQKNISGRPNTKALEYIFGRELEAEEIATFTLEKESMYRSLYKPYVKPIKGLLRLLEELSDEKIPVGIATSAIPDNIDFLWKHLPLQNYFHVVVDSSMVANSKPHPEPFLKVAEYLSVEPENCLAFEDSSSGLKSARAAGMKVVGIKTGLTEDEMGSFVDAAIDHYEGIDAKWLSKVVHSSKIQAE
jgi:beta-phosphoglucomutase family hydrolase